MVTSLTTRYVKIIKPLLCDIKIIIKKTYFLANSGENRTPNENKKKNKKSWPPGQFWNLNMINSFFWPKVKYSIVAKIQYKKINIPKYMYRVPLMNVNIVMIGKPSSGLKFMECAVNILWLQLNGVKNFSNNTIIT